MGRMKSFKTIDEQIDILRDKGLTISNDDKTKEILLRENYFFINGYRHLLFKGPKENTFIDGSSFDERYALFCFDINIINVMFKYLLIVENNLKSIFSYHLSGKYGYKEKEYLKMSNFVTDISKRRQVADVINKMKRQIKTNAKHNIITNIEYQSILLEKYPSESVSLTVNPSPELNVFVTLPVMVLPATSKSILLVLALPLLPLENPS